MASLTAILYSMKEVAVNKELVYNQNLQLPIATAAKETEEKKETPEK
ncbi:hypothetical protein [Nostoc sp.]